MATLTELHTIYGRGDTATDALFHKVQAAVMIAAEQIRLEAGTVPNNANRLKWAKFAWSDPVGASRQIWPAILSGVQVATPSVTLGQITGASDAAVQTAVNNTINIFADGT